MTLLWHRVRMLLGLAPTPSVQRLRDEIADLEPSTRALERRLDELPPEMTGNIIEDHLTGAAGKYQEGRRHGTR